MCHPKKLKGCASIMNESKIERAFNLGNIGNRYRERDYLVARALLEIPQGRSHNIRRAKTDELVLDNYSVTVFDDDLLVGRLSPCFDLTQEMQRTVDDAQQIEKHTGVMNGTHSGSTWHRVVDYEKLLNVGVRGVLEEIDGYLSAVVPGAADESDKRNFYEACRISIKAFCRFARRYHEKLTELYNAEKDPETAARYLAMANNFLRAPYEPCKHFYEALQCMWFYQFSLALADDVCLTGHLDEYLYPFYERDLREGIITREEALELIEELYLRHNELYGSWPASIMVCGTGRDGKTICNELSHLCIEAIETTRLVNPSVAVCYTPDLPDELMDKCVSVIARGFTRPAFFNDALIRKGLENAGVSKNDACRYIHSTCVEITPVAASNILVATPYINLCKIFEHIFSEKSKPYKLGKIDRVFPGGGGAEKECFFAHEFDFSLDELDTFEKFFELMKRAASEFVSAHVEASCELTAQRARFQSSPLSSPFINDCLARGADATAGGAKYNFVYPNFPGVINFIDSIAAVKKLFTKTDA